MDQEKSPFEICLINKKDNFLNFCTFGCLVWVWPPGNVAASSRNLDSKTYVNRSPNKVLAAHKQEKKKQYLQACLDQRRFFVPLIVSTDGMLGEETKATVKQLAWLLSRKWDRPYSQICGLIRSQLSVAIVRASHLCLRGSRVPYCEISRCIQWEGKAGVKLHQASLL